MRENSPISEDIIVRRVQRRLERYFSDLEKPKTESKRQVIEAAGTKIVTLSTEDKIPVVASAMSPPPPVQRPEVPSPNKQTQAPMPKTVVPTEAPPIFGKQPVAAKIAAQSLPPQSNSALKSPSKSSSSFLPIFMFFLALVATLGILLGWYWFTGGAGETLNP